jgi:hypothetical protein
MKRMLRKLIGLALVAMVLISPSVQAQDDINISVSLDRESIAADEQAILQIEISGPIQDLPNPTMPTLDKFEVYSQGRSSNISIVNGQVSSSVVYRYILIPQAAGTYSISGISIVHNGKTYSGNAVTLTVSGKGTAPSQLQQKGSTPDGQGKDYFLEASVDEHNPYVGQQITLTLKFYIAVQMYGSPSLDEPQTTGFWTEVLGNKAPYLQKVNNRTYRVIERGYALFPTQTGPLTIGRATIAATVAVRSRSRDPFDVFGDFFGQGQQVQVRSEPLRVIARPLPDEGRPADFSGTVGQYSMSVTPSKLTAEANQPITVTIKIEGTGNVKSVAEPAIPDLPDFRVYKASSNEQISKAGDKLSGSKVIEEVFIPRRPGELDIPSLSLSYFNPTKNSYQTIRTSPFKLTATKPEGYAASNDMPIAPSGVTIGSRSQDIRFIKQDIGKLQPIGTLLIFNPLYIAINALPVVLLAGVVVARRRREKLAANVGWARRRTAGKQARKRLAKARSMASIDKSGEFHAELSTAVTSYIADKLNISPYGLTTDSISQLLQAKGIDPALIAELNALLKQCDFARFAASTVTAESMAQALKTAEQLMTRMEETQIA